MTSADDDAEVFRLYALDELAKAGSLFARFDFGGDGYFVRKGDQDEESSGEGYFGRQSWALCRDGLFGDLHQDFVAHG